MAQTMRTHEVNLDNGRGFSPTEVIVRTDGTIFEKQVQEDLDCYASLKDLLPKLNKILEEHPDAELDMVERKYEDGMKTVIKWWEPLAETDRAVVQLKAELKKTEDRKRRQQEDELARLKRERPDLF